MAPSRVAAGTPAMLTIKGQDFFADVVTDFRRPANSELKAQFAVSLIAGDGATTVLAGVTFVDTTTLTAELPASVPRGLYDLSVTDPAGRTGMATGALRLVTSAESVAAFAFDAVDPQRAGVPFAVGLTAVDEVGQNVEGFDGTAQVTAPGGLPVIIGPFALGRARGFVTVAMPTAAVTLTASDALGHTGTSVPFDVTAGDPARVAFVVAPERVAAGACGGPFTIEVQDTFGNPAATSVGSAFTVAVSPPEGSALFSDGACSAGLDAGRVAGRSTFFVRATRAGRPQLRVVPEAWPSAVRELDVDAGAPMGLDIASAPQVLAAGMCSQPTVVRARDGFGNPTVVPAAVPLSIEVSPSTGVTLHGDSACAAALNALGLAAGAGEAVFHFRSAVPAMLELAVDGGVLGVALQAAEVTP